MTDLPASFGRWLRLRRRALDLTQGALARAVGCSVVTVRKLESDERRPSRQIAERLADALQISPHERASFVALARVGSEAAPERLPVDRLEGEHDRPSLAAPPAPRHRPPPIPLTRLLGRRSELAILRTTLLRGDTRLLTLTGLPGVGKTRLALQVASELRSAFPDGICFVDLAPVQDVELVLGAVAQALDLRPSGGVPLEERVAAYLHDKRLLLLLDNFEHLLDAAPLLVALLEGGPALKALVTSRAALRVRGEHVVPVVPLPISTSEVGTRRQALAQNPAVALFVERARAALPGFALTETSLPLVAELCAHLEGLPLAIELVAAQVDHLPLAELLSGLDRRLALLAGGPRDLPKRHQTLRAAIGESYALLDGATQILFRQLGVCVGGWTYQTASALAAAAGVAADPPVPQLLATLVVHSLVSMQGGAEQAPRFQMLETIRAYALELLAEGGEEPDARQAHAHFFRDLAARAEFEGPAQVAWLDLFDREHPNFRAALAWSLEQGERATSLSLVGSLEWFWFVRGHGDEGRRWLDRALAEYGPPVDGPDDALLASALLAAGHLALFAGDFVEARKRLEESAARLRTLAAASPGEGALRVKLIQALAYLVITVQYQGDFAAREALEAEYLRLNEGLDDPRAGALLAFQQGRGALLQFGDHRAAQGSLEQSLAVFRELGDLWTVAQVVIDLGLVALHQGDTAAARARYEQGVALARTIGDRGLLALALNNLGEAARAAGDLAAAKEHYTASLALHEELGNRPEAPRLLHNLGYVALREGFVARAVDYFRESLRRYQQLGMKRGVAEGLAGLAAVATCEGRPLEAARLWGTAEAMHTWEGTPVWPTDQREHAYYRAIARAQVSPLEWEAAWAEGRDKGLWQGPDDR